MKSLKSMLTVFNRKEVLLITIFGLLILIILSILLIPKKEEIQTPTQLTKREQKFPEAQPQSYSPAPSQQVGTLVVTSDTEAIRVIIDTPEEEGSGNILPVNITPFKIMRIPAGKHVLFASKPGYEFKQQEFQIKSNQITRLKLELTHQPENVGTLSTLTKQGWITKLPLKGKNYSAEYDQVKSYITVTVDINKSSSASLDQEKAEIAFEQAKEALRKIGVDLTKEKIEWVVK